MSDKKNDTSTFKSAFYSYVREVNKKRLISDEEENELGKLLNKIRKEEVLPYLKNINEICTTRFEEKTFDNETKSSIRAIRKLLPITL